MSHSKSKNKSEHVPTVSFHSRDRDWKVEVTPFASNSGWASFRQLRVARDGGTSLVLAPTFGARLFGLLFLAFGCGILAAYVHTFSDQKLRAQFPVGIGPMIGALAGCAFGTFLGGICIAMSLKMLTYTVRFDAVAGSLASRWLFATVSLMSLEEVVGVQLLDLGRMSIGGGRGGSTTVNMWQVNLVLEFPPAARHNVCTEPDGSFCRDVGRRLALLLDVPLVERVAAGALKM